MHTRDVGLLLRRFKALGTPKAKFTKDLSLAQGALLYGPKTFLAKCLLKAFTGEIRNSYAK